MNQDIKLSEQLNKIAELKAEIAYRDKTILAMEVTNIGTEHLRLQVTEQAALIEKLRDSLSKVVQWADVRGDFVDGPCVRRDVLASREAIATSTDSKQILADWMREHLVVYGYQYLVNDTYIGFSETEPLEGDYDEGSICALYRLPECLK